MPTTQELLKLTCQHAETALIPTEVADYLKAVPGWNTVDNRVVNNFKFNNYYETTAFLNAIAYIFHTEDHHPEITLTYSNCLIKFDTHSVNGGRGGLSINDFICAAKVNAVYQHAFA